MVEEQEQVRRSLIDRWFPERHVFLRTNGEIKGHVLTSGRQMMMAGAGIAVAAWTLVASGSFIFDLAARSRADDEIVRARAASERLNADLQARLETAVVRMSATTGGLDEMASMVERRHAALTGVMTMFRGVDGAEAVLAPRPPLPAAQTGPVQRIVAVRMDQERLIERAGDFAQTRAERLRLAFRLAGLNPAAYAASGSALGGPLVEARDPKALATILDVDEPFAIRIRHAADNLSEMRGLADAAEGLPFHRPTQARTTSGFGVRFDPFNGRPAVHQGQDFAAPLNTAIHATAPGIVSFAGVRSGYGNTVEIDHGRGFKTRFAHLNTMAVQPGQRVALGQRIGGMGTTGRSTGVHLHYEVWMDGRPQNPARFIRAGEQIVQ
ncbi:MAG: peptidoglycan DD-metalloendopeptidase family protein [Brevundimonas sp.]|uniref:peptidoglycan DD-metalloendopeptidase family protein n=1 Tax=Brevundimonas sp. TaxID=1871086 RepID=UPI0027345FB8|nr:peptidoglycan DD-metalloendopeptidase family protein [Brevundimonas sp.]MDP3403826.1 peptidoglycan DD-metalloendopeptidase family protein [Brevundimonas sp.]